MRKKTYAQNSYVFRQGAPTFGLLRVRSGVVIVQRVGSDGGVTVMHRAAEGDIFAEASLFSDHYHCDAVCVEPCEIDTVDKADVIRELDSNSLFSNALMAYLAHSLHNARELLALRSVASAEERILAGLRLGLLRDTVAAFAEHIGITPATCYRGLKVLLANGHVIKTSRGHYTLKSPKKRAFK